MHWEERFRQLAATQDGVIGIDQTSAVDCDAHHWWRARRSDRWEVLSRRVLRVCGTPTTDRQRILAGVLDAGCDAVLHGPSTLAWCDLRGYDLSQIHAARTRGRTNRPCALAVTHLLRDLRPHDLTILRGVPSVTPLRAIWAEAGRFSSPRRYEQGFKRIGRLLDDAHNKRLLTWAALHESLEGLQRSGRAGTRLMRELAHDERRQPGSSPTESKNEDRFHAVLQQAGRPTMQPQVMVGGHEVIGRADFRDPDLAVVAEVNSLGFHSTPSDQASDERRYAAMVTAGFSVAVVWEGDLWGATASVVATVDEARRTARHGRPAIFHSPSCPWPYDPARTVIGRGPYRWRD